MNKLRLDLDSVRVESFPTAHTAAELRGTIEGRAKGEPTHGGDCSGEGGCSGQLACSRQECSGMCTGYPGCSEDENCSELPDCTGIGFCYWTP